LARINASLMAFLIEMISDSIYILFLILYFLASSTGLISPIIPSIFLGNRFSIILETSSSFE